ncbi:MAG TPA: methyltransferase domain-containing protein [Luteimonas sp.]
MKPNLEVTGERVLEDDYRQSLGGYTIYAMHAASYAFAEPLCAGKRVLDLGCGSGYGTHRIAGHAAEVHGVDVAADAVAFADARYRKSNLHFRQVAAGARLPFEDGSFDVVLSFQVIEHVEDPAGYLGEAHRVLAPGGSLVLITPDRRNRLLPMQRPWNRWHLHEYSLEELAGFAARQFRVVRRLRMGAPWAIARVEIERYARTKWLTLPMTLPFMPEWVRVAGLDVVHRLMGARTTRRAPEPQAGYGFGEADFIIAEDPPNSLNLVVVAERGPDVTPD